jgi:hypothetical protein
MAPRADFILSLALLDSIELFITLEIIMPPKLPPFFCDCKASIAPYINFENSRKLS